MSSMLLTFCRVSYISTKEKKLEAIIVASDAILIASNLIVFFESLFGGQHLAIIDLREGEKVWEFTKRKRIIKK